MAVAYRHLAREAMPNASTVQNMVQRFGAPLGTALLAVMLQYRFVTEGAHDPVRTHALSTAFAQTFMLNFALALPIFVAAWVIYREHHRKK